VNELRISAVELSRTDNCQVVKVAGAVRRMRNWYRKMTNPEYREQVSKLQADSATVKHDLVELNKYILEVQRAIKDSDVESYNFAIDQVRSISRRLAGELKDFEQTAVRADPEPKQEFAEKYDPLPASLDRSERVHISNTVRTNTWNSTSLRNTLLRHNMDSTSVDAFMDDPAQVNAFYDAMSKAIKQGKIISSREAKRSKENIERNGEMQYDVITAPFTIPSTDIKVQLTAEGTDLSTRRRSPMPIFSVRSFRFLDARQ